MRTIFPHRPMLPKKRFTRSEMIELWLTTQHWSHPYFSEIGKILMKKDKVENLLKLLNRLTENVDFCYRRSDIENISNIQSIFYELKNNYIRNFYKVIPSDLKKDLIDSYIASKKQVIDVIIDYLDCPYSDAVKIENSIDNILKSESLRILSKKKNKIKKHYTDIQRMIYLDNFKKM